MKKQINYTELQQKVLSVVMTSGEAYVSEIAKKVFRGTRADLRPKNANNSIICVIRQINKKTPNHIKSVNRGCLGKLVYIKQA
jgi:hypothetical protein